MKLVLALLCALLLCCSAVISAEEIAADGAAARVVFREDFNGAVSDAWTIKNNADLYYSFASNHLVLRASFGDLFQNMNNYMNLFLIDNPASGNFTVTVRLLSFVPAARNHAQFNLVAYDSDDNYIRAGYGFIDGKRRLEIGAETEGTWNARSHTNDLGTDSFFLQLRKAGAVYTQHYSTDGIRFRQAGPPTRYGDGTPAKLGFVAMVDPTQSSEALIDYFEVTVEALPEWVESAAPSNDNAAPDAAIEITCRDAAILKPGSLRLFLDGRSVQSTLVTNSSGKTVITWQPPTLLEPGSSHGVRVEYGKADGKRDKASFSYNFSVNPHITLSK